MIARANEGKAKDAKCAGSASKVQAVSGKRSEGPQSWQIAYLQRTLGNKAIQRLYKSGRLQAALKIRQPNDVYEQEADRVADQVMRMPEPTVQLKPG